MDMDIISHGNDTVQWMDSQRIYHIMVDRFNGKWIESHNGNHFMGGTLQGIMEKLDYIRGMGFTAVWLSPVTCSSGYHGYHITDFRKIDSHFGTMEDFDRLIHSAHNLGMRVIVDFVPNHCSVHHPVFQEALHDESSPSRRYFYFGRKYKDRYKCFLHYRDLPKINLDNPDARRYMIDVARMYCEHQVDGLRIDHAVGPSFRFWDRMMGELKKDYPNVVFFGEVWASGISKRDFDTIHFRSREREKYYRANGLNQEMNQLDYVGVLDGVLDFEYREMVVSQLRQGNHILGNSRLEDAVKSHFDKYPDDFKLILFLDNHDLDRVLFECHGNETLMLEAMEFSLQWNRPFVMYYGTEQRMKNDVTIFDGTPYADLRVRECMDWSLQPERTLYYEIRDMVERSKRKESGT